MGVCTTEDQPNRSRNSINQTKENLKINEIESLKIVNQNKNKMPEYNYNKNIEISLNEKKTIIKSIGAIKGESISINNNLNCIILIMDYSHLVDIQNCQNCSIFLGPCETIINVQNCQGLNLISASLNLKISNVKNSNFYYFVSNSPIIESSQNIYLGNFFVQYMELPEMFIKSKLNIWNNKWSCYKEKGNNSDIKFSDDNIKQNVVEIFNPIFPSCYINIDQFQFVPFSYGKSLEIKNNYINFLIILRQEDFPEVEILKMILPEEIENYKVKLISTLVVNEKNEIIENIIKKLESNKENNILINYLLRNNKINNEGIESLQSSQNKNINQNNPSVNSITKSRLNDNDLSNNEYLCNNNLKFLKKRDFLFLWFIDEDIDFEEINDYFNSYFEPLYVGKILKEEFDYDEMTFKAYLEEIFEFKK